MLESRLILMTCALLNGVSVRDSFPSIDDLIEHILPCIDQHAGGATDTTLKRREAIVMFFHRHMTLSGSQMPSMGALIDDIVVVTTLYGKAVDYATSDKDADPNALSAVEITLVESIQSLGRTIPQVVKNPSDRWSKDATILCFDTLRSIFDWGNDENVRAYVYALTNEAMKDGLLGKERSLLLKAVKHCAEQHIRNEQLSE